MTDNQDNQRKQLHDESERSRENPQNEPGKSATPESSNHGGQSNAEKDTGKNKHSSGGKSSQVKPLGEQDKSPNSSNDDIADPMSSRDPSINKKP